MIIEADGGEYWEMDQRLPDAEDDDESYLYSDVGTTICPHQPYSMNASLVSKRSYVTTLDPSSSEDRRSYGQHSLSQSDTSPQPQHDDRNYRTSQQSYNLDDSLEV